MSQYQDNLNQLFDVPAIRQQRMDAVEEVKAYLKELTETSQKIRGLEFGIPVSSLKGMSEYVNQAEGLTSKQAANIKKLADSELVLARAEKTLAEARLINARAGKQEEEQSLRTAKAKTEEAKQTTELAKQKEIEQRMIIALQKEKERYEKLLAREEAQLAKNNSQYEQLKKKYNDAARAALELGAAEGSNSENFKKAAAGVQVMYKELLALELAVGRGQRQVGQYNMIVAQMNQLMREIPNFAQSLQIAIMSLGNNFSYFAESIKQARDRGESWMQIMKSLMTGMFGFVGIINLVVLGITMLTNQSAKAADNVKVLNKESEISTDVTNRAANTYTKAAVELEALRRRFFDAGTTIKQKNDIVEELNKKYGNTIGKLDGINEAEQFFIDRSDAFKEALFIRAQIEGAYDAIAENTKNLLQSQSKSAGDLQGFWKSAAQNIATFFEATDDALFGGVGGGRDRFLNTWYVRSEQYSKKARAKFGDDVDASNKKYQGFADELSKKLAELSEKFKFDFNGGNNSKGSADTLNQEMSVLERIAKARAEMRKVELEDDVNKQKLIVDNEKLSLRERMTALMSYFESKRALNNIDKNRDLETIELNLSRIAEIEGKADSKRTKQEKNLLLQKDAFLAERSAIVAKYQIKENDIIAEGEKLQQKLIDDTAKADEQALEKRKKAAEKWGRETQQQWEEQLRLEQRVSEERIRLEEKVAEARIKFMRQVADAAFTISDAITDRESRNLDRQAEDNRLNTEEELSYIASLDVTDKERQERKRRSEQQSIVNEKEIARDREALERKKFAINQASTLTNILFSTQQAVAKIQAEAAVLMATPATAGLAPLALAQIPYVYGSGAIAAGLVAAQVLAYAEGTGKDGHPGGLALMGEAGKELVVEPGKKPYWVTQPTLKNLPKDSHVFPMHRLHELGLDGAEMNNVTNYSYGDIQAMVNALHSQHNTLREIAQKPVGNVIIDGDGVRLSVKSAETTYNWLHRNIFD